MTVSRVDESAAGGSAWAADELAVLAGRLARISERFAWSHEDDLRLSLRAYRVLRALCRRGPLRMQALARALMLSKQTVSQTVDRLVVDGLATRAQDPDDRRHAVVTATDEGQQRLAQYLAAFTQHLQGALDGLDEREAEAAAAALQRLNDQIEAKREAGYFRTLRGVSSRREGRGGREADGGYPRSTRERGGAHA